MCIDVDECEEEEEEEGEEGEDKNCGHQSEDEVGTRAPALAVNPESNK